MRFVWLFVVGCILGVGSAAGQSAARSALPAAPDAPASTAEAETSSRNAFRAPDDAALYYVAGDDAMLYNRPDSTLPVRHLPVRAQVHRGSCTAGWCRVHTENGRSGYVPKVALSNVWIRASKRDRRVYVYRGPRLVHVFRADFGYNAFSDKERRGTLERRDHWRTPEGLFYVVRKNPDSEFYKALVLNYPTASDARRGLKQGIISRTEHNAIVRAADAFRMPPMNTELGGWVELHGDGTGAATNWTRGCVAITNADMDRIWWWVQVGTPVLVE